MALYTDRRALLMGAPALAIVASAPALAITSNNRAAWDAAMRAYLAAKAEREAFAPIYSQIFDIWYNSRPSMDGIHWPEFHFANRNEVARTLDLEKAWAHFLRGEGQFWWAKDEEGSKKAKASYRAALDSVQAFRDAEAAHNRDTGMDAASDESDRLDDIENGAETALMDMPAPDLPALRWKLDRIFDLHDDGMQPWTVKYVGQAMSDYARLLGEAG